VAKGKANRAALELRIVGRRLPGLRFCEREPVYVGVQRQRRAEVVDLVPGDVDEACFSLAVKVVTDGADGGMDFRGPFVHGRRGERFLYLSWGYVGPGGAFEMFRRAKLHLSTIDEGDIARALASGAAITGALDLTGKRGAPLCAAVRPPSIAWRVDAPADGV